MALIDQEDVGILAQSAALLLIAIVVIIALAGAAGIAWTVFRLTGGL